MKEDSIDHDLTLDRNLNHLFFFYKKDVFVVLKIMHAQQENKSSTSFYETDSHFASARMIRKRKCDKSDDSLNIDKFCNI